MSLLKNIREKQNLTQEELSAQSGVSVRTIQRIEAGTIPKGYTLKTLARTLNVTENELLTVATLPEKESENPLALNYTTLKLINLSSLPFIILPPLNILLPLILMFTLKQKNYIVKQIITLQIMWTIMAPILFMLVIFMKLGNNVALIAMIVLVLSNVYIVLRNTAQLDRKKQLGIKLNFSML